MKRVLLVFGLMLFCMGCATRLSPGNLKGEWQFAYIVEGMAPPRFDKLEFVDGQRLRLGSSLDDKMLETTYSLTAKTLVFGIVPPGQPVRIETVAAELGEMGLGLTLESQGTRMKYFRPDFLLHDDVAGTWSGAEGLASLAFAEDGKLHLVDNKITGYYRLWRSKAGKCITLVMDDAEHGPFAVSFIYKLRGENLELTPVLAKDTPPTRLTRKR